MTVDVLLSRLEGVRKTGRDSWRARCPGHGSKGQTLAVRERSDGAVLVHCFAGCSVHDVIAAVGLEMDALFPAKPAAGMFNHHRVERRPFNAHDVLACVAFEAMVALQHANTLRAGASITVDEHARLVTACGRLTTAMDMVNG